MFSSFLDNSVYCLVKKTSLLTLMNNDWFTSAVKELLPSVLAVLHG